MFSWTLAELAYMAGIIDGEVTITVFPYYGINHRLNRRYHRYRPNLSVTNTDERLMDWLVEHFGGKKKLVKRARDLEMKYKPTYHWAVSHQVAAHIVAAIAPFLVIKRRQAEIFIRFMRTMKRIGGRRGTPVEVLKEREELSVMIRTLNGRGFDALDAIKRVVFHEACESA